jgi:hypothetical protein
MKKSNQYSVCIRFFPKSRSKKKMSNFLGLTTMELYPKIAGTLLTLM